MRSRFVSAVGFAVLVGGGGLGCGTPTVIRVMEGVPREGRFVSDFAYAAFARGAEHEARGQLPEAALAYRDAIERDPEAILAWVRAGAVACRVGDAAGAQTAFDEAERLDVDFEPLWRERAICAVDVGDRGRAVELSARAVSADPTRVETVLLHAATLAAADRAAEARPWLQSLAVRMPHRVDVWEASREVARALGDDDWARAASRSIDRLERRADPRVRPEGWREVDEALVARDLEGARRAARLGRLDVRLLAARAILAGRPDLAREDARLRLDADPTDGDALVALLVAADLVGAEAPRWAPSRIPLAEPTRWLLAEWLLRHEGPEAARSWLGHDVGDPRHGLARAFAPTSAGKGP